EVSPSGAVERRSMAGRGLRAELIQSRQHNRLEFRYCGPLHLILAYEQSAGCRGETFVDGVSASALQDFKRRLMFLPAGHDYCEWRQLHAPARLLCVYFDPGHLDVQSALASSIRPVAPRLFFEDASLWSTVDKLKDLLESPGRESVAYFEALGAVLVHELVRF